MKDRRGLMRGCSCTHTRVPGKRWNLLHSLRFKSFHNSGRRGGARPGDPFVWAELASPPVLPPPEPCEARRDQHGQARA